MNAKFAHLHVHGSTGSRLDGFSPSKDLAEAAARDGQPALAITDHDGVAGWVDHENACADAGIRPIFGRELYSCPDRDEKTDGDEGRAYWHQVVWAETPAGRDNIMRLSSLGYLEGFYRKPRVDYAHLATHTAGVIASTSCLGGEVPAALLAGDRARADQVLDRMVETYGPANVMVEIQAHGIPEQLRIMPALVDMARRRGLALLATNDVHYCGEHHAHGHDALLCVGTKAKLADEKRFRFESRHHWLKTAAEMTAACHEDAWPEAVRNTLVLAERCSSVTLGIEPGQFLLPAFPLPDGYATSADYLRHLVTEGARRRYGSLDLRPDVAERLDYELSVIHGSGFGDYFLILWDVVDWCARPDVAIAVGPGRGSGAGCCVAYCLGITGVDPLRWGLLFERFLNPERVSPPDIDVDYDPRRRQDVFEYLRDRWGADRVTQIATAGMIKGRSAIKDAARVLGKPVALGQRMSDLMPPNQFGRDASLAACFEPDPGTPWAYPGAVELRALAETDEDAGEIIALARQLEGRERTVGIHAGAAVVTPGPAIDMLPLQTVAEKRNGKPTGRRIVVTQETMDAVEARGALKMDVLGLTFLPCVADPCRALGLDPYEIPLDDPKTWDLLRRGDTAGVFQLAAGHARSLLRQVAPDDLNELAAVSALDRPGPMSSGMHTAYARRKHGTEDAAAAHPVLEEVLAETYGLMIFQEQMMRVAQVFAGYTLGQADLLRKATGKKKKDVMAAERERFVAGGLAQGHTEAEGHALFDLIEPFADYSFNKSHALAYSLVSYWTAWLKVHHPAEFFAAMIDASSSKLEKAAVHVAEARRIGVQVLPPCVNRSQALTTGSDGVIMLGLGLVRGVGDGLAEKIVALRGEGWDSPAELYARCSPARDKAENLIKAGAFDVFGVPRAVLCEHVAGELLAAKKRKGGQATLGLDVAQPAGSWSADQEWAPKEKLTNERHALGLYVSGHPLEHLSDRIEAETSHLPADLDDANDGETVCVAGIALRVQHGKTRKGAAKITFTLDGLAGSVEVIAAGRGVKAMEVAEGAAVVVLGTLRKEEAVSDGDEGAPAAECKILANAVSRLVEENFERFRFPFDDAAPAELQRRRVAELRRQIAAHPGPHLVEIEVGGRVLCLGQRFRVSAAAVPLLEQLLGPAASAA